ncbi:MAG: SDR family oxidoreductase [Alphaproteobacteria bacterium]|nr:SDR family oxidoreductase [Alphaproteobacteria bacterium]
MQTNDAIYPSLRDRAVLVTGGASGIGAAIVEHFAAQGARVAFLDIADAAAAALRTRIEGNGRPPPHYAHADVTDIPAMQEAIRDAAGRVGPFHVLVNNAAHDDRHDWAEVTPEYWDGRLAVNLRHQFFAIQAVAPAMIAAGAGSIINFGSCSWHLGVGGMPGYVAAKAAVEGLTRSFARDLGEHRIRVNCVIPGWIMTERQLALWVDEAAEAARHAGQCVKDRLYPADVARLVLWLAADDSRMATAQTWTMDGGWT